MRFVPIEYVKENDILGKNVYDSEGRILLKSGINLTPNLIERLKSINIMSLYISDSYCDEELVEVISQELRQNSISVIKESFVKMQGMTLADRFSKKQDKYIQDIENVMENIIEEILNNKDLIISLIDIKSLDNYIYAHCVNVAVIATMIGIYLKLPKLKLKYLALGAIMHDIGKVFMPKEILQKRTVFDESEEKIIMKHTSIGYNYLREISSLSAESRIIALQHHERVDGNGYPDNLEADKISYLAKIVSVADVYDNMCSDSAETRAVSPGEAIEYIMANSGSQFDSEVVNAFLKIVYPYPKGTFVNLSTNEVGVVLENTKNYPLRPKVKILKSDNKDNIGRTIDLLKENSIVIINVCYEI